MNPRDTHGTDPFEHHAGAYVLGALPEHEAGEFSAHLQHCPACARSVAELAHLPALLDRVSPADVRRLRQGPEDDDAAAAAEGLEPPPTLLPTLLNRAGVARPRRRWGSVAALVAAAAAGVLVLAAVEAVEARMDADDQARRPTATAPASTPSPSPGVEPLVLRPVGRQPLTAAVRMEQVAWGTKIELTCAYSSTRTQYPSGTAYALVVSDGFGHDQQVATWKPIAGKTLKVPAATSLSRPVISRVEVRGSDGTVLLTASPSALG